MKTIIEKTGKKQLNRAAILRAGEIIKKGGLVAIPTETVYGLGANALDEEAAGKTYAAKGRPSDNPLIVHIARFEDLETVAEHISEKGWKLAHAFWPGPMTLIFDKAEIVPHGTTGGLDTVAVRMPVDEIAREVILAGGGFVSAPSANTSGRPSPTTAQHVAEDLDGKIDMILDGGEVEIGVESTIVDMTVEPPMILRPGAITKEMLESVVGEIAVDVTIQQGIRTQAPKAPGMKYKHYAPKADLWLVEGQSEDVVLAMQKLVHEKIEAGIPVGVIATEESRPYFSEGVIKVIGSRGNDESIAKHLYGILREFDEENVEYIYSEEFHTEGIGAAIMNRLLKAAGYQRLDANQILKRKDEMDKRKDYISWDEYFMGVAILSGMRSKDPNTQVGACIVSQNNKILSMGYNGFPIGCSDDDFPWQREGEPMDTKYLYTTHSELNAILNYRGGSLDGAKLYVTLFPCNECAKAIIQCGIKEVIYACDKYENTFSVMASKKMMDAAGVHYHKYIPSNREIHMTV